ncbi:MAG TPA: mechanosensitive ion channel family protein [Oculatellaceae cyanobacterium]
MEHAISLTLKTIIEMCDGFFKLLPNILIGTAVFYVFTKLADVVRRIVVAVGVRARLDMTLCQALGSLSSVATTVFGLLIAATIIIPSFKASHLIAGLGITSVAVGFAFKDILQNFFAGLLLLWQKPFKIGDYIRTKDFEGTVLQIDIHSTRIVSNSGQLVVLPNGDVFTNPIVINTAHEGLRQHLTVAGPTSVPLEDARALILKTVQETEGVLKTPAPKVYLAAVDLDAPKFEVYFWCKPKEEEMSGSLDRVATAIRSVTKQAVKAQPSDFPVPGQPGQPRQPGERISAGPNPQVQNLAMRSAAPQSKY